MLQFDDRNPSVLRIHLFFHAPDDFLRLLHRLTDDLCQSGNLHRLSHRKENRFNYRFRPASFQFCIPLLSLQFSRHPIPGAAASMPLPIFCQITVSMPLPYWQSVFHQIYAPAQSVSFPPSSVPESPGK